MFDRKTFTLWRQLTGEPVVGPLADSDIQLKLLPLELTTWEDWVRDHPGLCQGSCPLCSCSLQF